jgi:hypothetical protein
MSRIIQIIRGLKSLPENEREDQGDERRKQCPDERRIEQLFGWCRKQPNRSNVKQLFLQPVVHLAPHSPSSLQQLNNIDPALPRKEVYDLRLNIESAEMPFGHPEAYRSPETAKGVYNAFQNLIDEESRNIWSDRTLHRLESVVII